MYARVFRIILVVAAVEMFVVGFGGRWMLLAGVPIPYASLVVLSFLVYGSSGYLVAGFASTGLTAFAGAAVAVIDAVVWAAIGAPDVDPSVSLDPSPIDLTFTPLMMAVTGGVMGLLGGVTAGWIRRARFIATGRLLVTIKEANGPALTAFRHISTGIVAPKTIRWNLPPTSHRGEASS